MLCTKVRKRPVWVSHIGASLTFHCSPCREANLPLECRMSEDGRLDLVGYETFNDVLDYPVSAHPIQDGDELLFHSYTVDQKLIEDHGTMKLGRYNSQKDQVETYFVPTPSKSYVSFAHSIISTDNYIIVWDCSVHFKTDALFTGGSFFKSNRSFTLKFGVVPKNKDNVQTDDVLWIDSCEVRLQQQQELVFIDAALNFLSPFVLPGWRHCPPSTCLGRARQ